MVADEERKKIARAEALERVKLQRQGKIPPSPWEFVVVFLVFIAMNYYLFDYSFRESLGRAAWLSLIYMVFSYGLYKYRGYRYSKKKEK